MESSAGKEDPVELDSNQSVRRYGNWRQAFSKASAGLLIQLGPSARQVELLSVRALVGTHQIYNIFRTSTATASGSDKRKTCGSSSMRPNAREVRGPDTGTQGDHKTYQADTRPDKIRDIKLSVTRDSAASEVAGVVADVL